MKVALALVLIGFALASAHADQGAQVCVEGVSREGVFRVTACASAPLGHPLGDAQLRYHYTKNRRLLAPR